MKFPLKRRGRKPRAKKSVVKKALNKARTQSIAKVVKKVLSRQEEIKCVTYSRNIVNVGAITSSSVTLDAANITVVNPSNISSYGYSIPQGTGNAQRIGNRVKMNKCLFQYTIQPKAYNATSNTILTPFYIRFYLVKSKIAPTSAPTIAQILNQFYENGSSMTGFTGEFMDLNRKVCPDTFTYLTHWDHKIGFAANNQNGVNTLQHNTNNDFKMVAVGNKDLTKHIPKQTVFDDNNLVNTDCVFVIWNIYSTGTSPYPVTQFPCFITYNTQYYYTDA